MSTGQIRAIQNRPLVPVCRNTGLQLPYTRITLMSRGRFGPMFVTSPNLCPLALVYDQRVVSLSVVSPMWDLCRGMSEAAGARGRHSLSASYAARSSLGQEVKRNVGPTQSMVPPVPTSPARLTGLSHVGLPDFVPLKSSPC